VEYTVVVRQARPADVAAAAEVWCASHLARRNRRRLPKEYHDQIYGRMTAPGAVLLVAEDHRPAGPDAGEDPEAASTPPVVGATLGLPGREDDGVGPPLAGLLHISMVSVLPDRWGERVGRRLVEALLDTAAARGYRRAQLWMPADSARVNRLCRATDFRRTGRARIDDWGELVVDYQRDIGAPPAV
jgi:GNAT superfamily N-acetyltransferase